MFDGGANVGRELTLALELATTANNEATSIENMPSFSLDGKIKMA